ncbi:hypothetical protein WJX72_007511 [[Myrmecia] bisecta]|uniref:GCVT N-terminal domain-containing protein n=1 Tax=[Myrmecia] bisecta TaxID=41462 RepID=A0AAW1PP67_9CHLO
MQARCFTANRSAGIASCSPRCQSPQARAQPAARIQQYIVSHLPRSSAADYFVLKTAPHFRSRGRCASSPVDIDLDSLDIPEIDADIRSYQEEDGAEFTADGIALTFNNEKKAAAALENGAVVVNQSHWGRLRVSGDDRLTFLHGQSTNDFKSLRPGQGCDTVVVTAQGRTIELVSCYVQGNGVLVVVPPGMKEGLLARLNKYIFFGDKVAVQDISDRCCMLTLAGPEADNILSDLGAGKVVGQDHGTHILLNSRGSPVIVARGCGLATSGYTLIGDEAIGGELWRTLRAKGALPMGEQGWQTARTLQGRPLAGAELTEDYNPLEAGLYSAVSVDKGCYIGQETIAKVANLNAVKQQLWGLDMATPVRPGDTITAAGEKLGRVTSVAMKPDGTPFALGYLKSKSRGAALQLKGLKVEAAGIQGTVVPIPYATRAFADASSSGAAAEEEVSEAELSERAAAARQAKAVAAAAAEAAKAERLAAMQARLAAWQAQQASSGASPQ